jgi:hypothetical protein
VFNVHKKCAEDQTLGIICRLPWSKCVNGIYENRDLQTPFEFKTLSPDKADPDYSKGSL